MKKLLLSATALVALALFWKVLSPHNSVFRMLSSISSSPTSVLTQHGDNYRTGATLTEKVLTQSNVNSQSFGRLFTRSVDGPIYTQPLIVPGLKIPTKGVRNVVFVATMHDTVYAYDADGTFEADPLWTRSLGTSYLVKDIPTGNVPMKNMQTEVGVLSTPAIDLSSQTLYVVALVNQSKVSGQPIAAHYLHALDLTTGAEKPGSPVQISGSVPGTGDGSSGGTIAFDSAHHLQRASLLLSNGTVYVAFASYIDARPYHGWLMAYDAKSLLQVGTFNSSPSGGGGGIWMSGQGPSVDDEGNIYVVTGNGFDIAPDGSNYPESVIRLKHSSSGFTIADWFVPSDWQQMDESDYDLGVSGAILVPSTKQAIVAGKDGSIMLMDMGNLGHLSTSNEANAQRVKAVSGNFWGNMVLWNNHLYIWGDADHLRSFTYANGKISPEGQSSLSSKGNSWPVISVSSNGSDPNSAVLWATVPDQAGAVNINTHGALHAFAANNLQTELWNSDTNQQADDLGNVAKFAAPTIANGKVYVPTFSDLLTVYGIQDPSLTYVPNPTQAFNLVSSAGINAEPLIPGIQTTYGMVNTFVFKPRCMQCHSSGMAPDLSDYSKFATNSAFIVPGDPANSVLYQEVASGAMPKTGSQLNWLQLQLLANWIKDGAKNN